MPIAFGAQLGRLFLLKTTNNTSPTAQHTIGGMKATTMSIGNAVVDVTTKDEAPWKTLLANCGDRSVNMTCAGVCKDTVGENDMQQYALNGGMGIFSIIDQAGDEMHGSFLVSKFEWTGNHNGAQEYSMSLESSGTVIYVPHV